MTQPETTLPVVRHDRWSLWPLAAALPAVILLWCCIVGNAELPTMLLVLFAALVIFIAAVIAMLVHLVRRRVRAVLSALAGNRDVILNLLKRALRRRGLVLEIANGAGENVRSCEKPRESQ